MKKNNLYLKVTADNLELILDFDSNIFNMCKVLGITKDGFYSGVRRNSINKTENCRYEILNLNNKVHKGQYRIVLFESEKDKRLRLCNQNPIITTKEEFLEIKNNQVKNNLVNDKARNIIEIYEFDNFEDFLDYRCDLISLGCKNDIQCFCKI
ncbi:MAG: hypothetical protein IKI95_07985 [Clostridia bacterium]|nr:hypothetical protein [Clostridia bacterium]